MWMFLKRKNIFLHFEYIDERKAFKMHKRNLIPTQSEIKRNLGDELANAVFELSHDEINKILGLSSPPLVVPEKEPLIHSNYIKAYTHNAILQIGEQALEKYCQDTEERIKVKFFQDIVKEKNLSKAERRRAVELVFQKTRERYKNRILELKSRFKDELESELEKTMNDCKMKMQEAILQERESITREMLKKMRDEVGFAVTSLYHDFELKLIAEKQNMIMEFNQIMRRDRLKTDAVMKEMIRQKEEEFQIKFHEFELQKIVDLTYILCSERMRCSSERHEIHQTFEKRIEAVQKMLLEANHVIKLLKEKENSVNENDKKWIAKIIEIVKQFQKFINFAFGAVPGQVEFLLSLESLLTFELDKKISENDDKKHVEESGVFRVIEIVDKYGRKWKPVQLIPDIFQPCSAEDDCTIKGNREEICRNLENGSFRCLRSKLRSNSISFCNFQKTFFERADFHSGDIKKETRTMTELAENARFVVELESTKTSNLKLVQKQQKETQSLDDSEQQIKPGLSRDNLLEKIKAHNKMIKSVTQVKENDKQMFKIVGDNGIEHLQTFEEFTISRMQSLKRIFKLHPSLQHILIP